MARCSHQRSAICSNLDRSLCPYTHDGRCDQTKTYSVWGFGLPWLCLEADKHGRYQTIFYGDAVDLSVSSATYHHIPELLRIAQQPIPDTQIAQEVKNPRESETPSTEPSCASCGLEPCFTLWLTATGIAVQRRPASPTTPPWPLEPYKNPGTSCFVHRSIGF